MTLIINDTTMTSDQTPHTARHAPTQNGWEVSWLPGRILDRNTAITAMILADTTADEHVREGHCGEALRIPMASGCSGTGHADGGHGPGGFVGGGTVPMSDPGCQ
jgi:hypothetical protein